MDYSWVKANRLSKEYKNGVIQFLNLWRKIFLTIMRFFYCPCKKCYNMQKHAKKRYVYSFRL